MADMIVDVVGVEQMFWSGRARLVTAQTTEGEIGIMVGHEPLLGQLVDDGVVIIEAADGQRHVAAVHGGFLSVTAGKVTVLAETARWAADVDVAEAESLAAGDDHAARAAKGDLRAAARART